MSLNQDFPEITPKATFCVCADEPNSWMVQGYFFCEKCHGLRPAQLLTNEQAELVLAALDEAADAEGQHTNDDGDQDEDAAERQTALEEARELIDTNLCPEMLPFVATYRVGADVGVQVVYAHTPTAAHLEADIYTHGYRPLMVVSPDTNTAHEAGRDFLKQVKASFGLELDSVQRIPDAFVAEYQALPADQKTNEHEAVLLYHWTEYERLFQERRQLVVQHKWAKRTATPEQTEQYFARLTAVDAKLDALNIVMDDGAFCVGFATRPTGDVALVVLSPLTAQQE